MWRHEYPLWITWQRMSSYCRNPKLEGETAHPPVATPLHLYSVATSLLFILTALSSLRKYDYSVLSKMDELATFEEAKSKCALTRRRLVEIDDAEDYKDLFRKLKEYDCLISFI